MTCRRNHSYRTAIAMLSKAPLALAAGKTIGDFVDTIYSHAEAQARQSPELPMTEDEGGAFRRFAVNAKRLGFPLDIKGHPPMRNAEKRAIANFALSVEKTMATVNAVRPVVTGIPNAHGMLRDPTRKNLDRHPSPDASAYRMHLPPLTKRPTQSERVRTIIAGLRKKLETHEKHSATQLVAITPLYRMADARLQNMADAYQANPQNMSIRDEFAEAVLAYVEIDEKRRRIIAPPVTNLGLVGSPMPSIITDTGSSLYPRPVGPQTVLVYTKVHDGSAPTTETIDSQTIETLSATIEELAQMFDKPLFPNGITIRFDRVERPSYFPANGDAGATIVLPHDIRHGNALRQSLAHEVGHAIQTDYPGVYKACMSYLAERSRQPNSAAPTEIDGHPAYPNHFTAPYTGKTYPGFQQTEILPVALEQFIENPISLMQSDAGLFEFLVGCLQGDYTQE